jgi:hypothetical protein
MKRRRSFANARECIIFLLALLGKPKSSLRTPMLMDLKISAPPSVALRAPVNNTRFSRARRCEREGRRASGYLVAEGRLLKGMTMMHPSRADRLNSPLVG